LVAVAKHRDAAGNGGRRDRRQFRQRLECCVDRRVGLVIVAYLANLDAGGLELPVELDRSEDRVLLVTGAALCIFRTIGPKKPES
jgi:hypothetical protein